MYPKASARSIGDFELAEGDVGVGEHWLIIIRVVNHKTIIC